MPDKTATRRLILEAVVTCIEKCEIDTVTTRKFAQQAGTNTASVNHYFQSKDDLLGETLSMTINDMLEDVYADIGNPQQPFETALSNILFYLLDGARQFPGISRHHLYRALVQNDRQSISSHAMSRVFDRLAKRAVAEESREGSQAAASGDIPDNVFDHVRTAGRRLLCSGARVQANPLKERASTGRGLHVGTPGHALAQEGYLYVG